LGGLLGGRVGVVLWQLWLSCGCLCRPVGPVVLWQHVCEGDEGEAVWT